MPWVFDTDSFIIKSEGIFDFDQFINTIMGTEDVSLAGLQNAVYGMDHNFDDFEGRQMNAYEADAIEMAIRSGKIDANIGQIIHSGPGTPGYEQAVSQALAVGRPLVNAAAEKQIEINNQAGHGFQAPPLPFRPDGRLNAEYVSGAGATSTVNMQKTGPMGKRRGMGSFNPYNANGELVTSILSGRNNQQEGWARWYEEGAKELGLVETRYNRQGQPRGDKRFVIPAHYVHNDVISINDKNLLTRISNHIKGLQGQGMAHDQIKADLIQQPFMFNALHHSYHNFDSIHNRIERKHQENQEIRDGLMQPAEDDDLDAAAGQPGIPGLDSIDRSIIPPEAQGDAWARWTNNHNYGSHNKRSVKQMMSAFDMEEEEAKAIFDRANMSPDQSGLKGGRESRLFQLLYMHEMDKHGGNLPQDHHYTGPRPPLDGRGIQPGAPAPSPVVAQPPGPVPQPNIPPNVRANPPAPPSPLGPQVVATPPPMVNAAPKPPTQYDVAPSRMGAMARGITNQNSNIPLSESDSVGPTVGERLSRFAELLGRASSNDIFRRSDEFKTEIEDYIEGVQVELAKTVIEDYQDIKKMDINNPLDIAILGSRIQRPTNDVITIFHTRGDWRNIAKSFHVDHKDVQLVKVALNG